MSNSPYNYNGSAIYEMLYHQLNTNGNLDTSIDTAGDNYVTLQINGNGDYLRGMSIQPDDTPVLAGHWVDGSADGYSGLVRLKTAGTLDTSFNTIGIYEVNPPLSAQTPYSDQYWDIAFDASNRIVAIGYNRKDASYWNGQISRFTSAGAPPDTTYVYQRTHDHLKHQLYPVQWSRLRRQKRLYYTSGSY